MEKTSSLRLDINPGSYLCPKSDLCVIQSHTHSCRSRYLGCLRSTTKSIELLIFQAWTTKESWASSLRFINVSCPYLGRYFLKQMLLQWWKDNPSERNNKAGNKIGAQNELDMTRPNSGKGRKKTKTKHSEIYGHFRYCLHISASNCALSLVFFSWMPKP